MKKNPKTHTYSCETCKFYTAHHNDYIKHLDTRKHQKLHESGYKDESNDSQTIYKPIIFTCKHCTKIYQTSAGLWKHKKQCNISNLDNNESMNKLILKIIEENSTLVNKLANDSTELQNIIKEMIKNGLINSSTNNSHNTTNNQNSNNTFNLQVYLNETCKNAMNLSEFVNTIVPTLEELEKTARDGYVKGISSIVNTRLDKVNKKDQPIHCTDGKREVLYIKENNVWNKEDEEKPLLLRAIKEVARKNICNILEWKKLYPDCTDSDSRKNDLYLKILLNAMSGGSEEESKTNYDKIMSVVAKHTIVEKNSI